MLQKWAEVTTGEGSAAHATAQLAANRTIIDGFVLSSTAMAPTLEERREQLESLLKVRDAENHERVAAELKRTILTVHVPRDVQQALDDAFKALGSPVLMRLSNVDPVADPLAPAMVIGLDNGKVMLDALRMLYAEMYSATNLELESPMHRAAVIVQRQPALNATYRIIRAGAHTVVEGTRGLGCWVGYGEPDRFLFEGETFQRAENGDGAGIRWSDGLEEFTRTPLGGDDAQRVLAFAKDYLASTSAPLLFCETDNGILCLGAGPDTATK